MQPKARRIPALAISMVIIGMLATLNFFPLGFASGGLTYPASPVVPVQPISQGVITDGGRQVFYWLQLSDIHINMQKAEERRMMFDRFCGVINSTLRPAFVISSGDNIDAVENTAFMFYEQDPNEYIFFNTTLAKYGFNTSFWYSVIGNHERYDTGLDYSLWYQYMRNQSQYAVDFDTGFGRYRFVMLDTNHDVGLNSFFCLYGDMRTAKLNNIEQLLSYGSGSIGQVPTNINGTIMIGHHPTNVVESERADSGRKFLDLFKNYPISAYLTGHLHYRDLYANRETFDELHCASFKGDGDYRICAYDNDIFSFKDAVIDSWPQIVITNPTDSRFYTPTMPLSRMATQNEIRTLIFDNASITAAYAEIDGVKVGDLVPVGGNLWSVPYDAAQYKTGSHTLKIHAESENGKVDQEIDFSLSDFTPTPIKSTSISFYFAGPLFEVAVSVIIALTGICVLLLILSRPFNKKHKEDKAMGRMQKFISTAGTLPPLKVALILVIFLYVLLGPLMVGQLSGSQIGFVFLTRVLVGGEYALSVLCQLTGLVFIIMASVFSMYVVFQAANPKSKVTKFTMGMTILLLGVGIFMSALYNGFYSPLITPINYLVIGAIVLIQKSTKTASNDKSP